MQASGKLPVGGGLWNFSGGGAWVPVDTLLGHHPFLPSFLYSFLYSGMSEAEVCWGDPFSCGDSAWMQTSWGNSILVLFSREGAQLHHGRNCGPAGWTHCVPLPPSHRSSAHCPR